MSREDETFRKVMKELKNHKGMTQKEREERARLIAQAEERNKKFKASQDRVKKLREKKRKGGDDGVIDSGMFSS